MEDIKHATGTTTTNDQSAPFHLTDVDRAILAQSDDEFVPHSWEELKEIVGMHAPPSIRHTFVLVVMVDLHIQRKTIFRSSGGNPLSWHGTSNGPAK